MNNIPEGRNYITHRGVLFGLATMFLQTNPQTSLLLAVVGLLS